MYHANVNANFMVENVIQIKNGIMKIIDIVIYVKKIIFRILLHVVEKMTNI